MTNGVFYTLDSPSSLYTGCLKK